MSGKQNTPAEWDVVELENFVRAPFRSGGTKVFDENGNLQYLPGPQKIPITRGRQEIYMNGKNIGNDGAKLVANELKKNMDCLSLWLHGNGIKKEGATELAKALQFNTTLTVGREMQVPHEPWTTSVSQLSIKKAQLKKMEFRWEPGSRYGITGISHLQDPWQRSLAPTLFPGLSPIPKGLSGISRDDPGAIKKMQLVDMLTYWQSLIRTGSTDL
eukprot:752422-Hanusia_phi.AAC.5